MTKFFKERTEIAQAINGRKIPVVKIDIADVDEYGLVSEPVVIDNGVFKSRYGLPEMPYMINAEIRVFSDEKKFTIKSYGTSIHSDFGYSDVDEMLKYRNAPVIEKDSDVLIVVVNSRTREAFAPFVLHTTDRINAHCSTPLSFVSDTATELIGEVYIEKGREELKAKGEKYLGDD